MVEKQLTVKTTYDKSQNQPGYESTVLDWRSPPGRVQEVLKNRKFTFYPFAEDDVSSQADGSTTTFNTNHDLVNSPNIDENDNAVAEVNGSTVQVSSFDESNNTVTLSSAPASDAEVKLYYPPSSGNVRVIATTPDLESGTEELLNEHIATFTKNNQVVPNTQRTIDNSFILDEKWHLIVKVNANYQIASWEAPTVQRAKITIERLRKNQLSGKQKKEVEKDKQRLLKTQF